VPLPISKFGLQIKLIVGFTSIFCANERFAVANPSMQATCNCRPAYIVNKCCENRSCSLRKRLDELPARLYLARMEHAKPLAIAVCIVLLWVAESAFPHLAEFATARARWRHAARNLCLALMNWGLALAGLAALITWSASHDFGLFNRLNIPEPAGSLLILLCFDAWMYGWHRLNHVVPLLWRFHRVHHSDPTMDVSSGLRFHPGEIILSGLARALVLPVLGMSITQLLLYETVLLPVVLFHHCNLALPRRLDDPIRKLIVTPWMHWVHHSRIREETNSNYGSVLSIWDRLFGSYRFRADADAIVFGLDEFAEEADHTVTGMLRTPLRGKNQSSPPP
jgi:sterol desaturase/sphingolipid hydroxylase (fatty acid hydroxylase superfamily)